MCSAKVNIMSTSVRKLDLLVNVLREPKDEPSMSPNSVVMSLLQQLLVTRVLRHPLGPKNKYD